MLKDAKVVTSKFLQLKDKLNDAMRKMSVQIIIVLLWGWVSTKLLVIYTHYRRLLENSVYFYTNY